MLLKVQYLLPIGLVLNLSTNWYDTVYKVLKALLNGFDLPFHLSVCLLMIESGHGIINIDIFHQLQPEVEVELWVCICEYGVWLPT